MYNWGDARPAHDRLWREVRDRLRAGGVEAPEALTHGDDLWAQWTAPDLLLSQTCGLPYRTRLHDRVTLVGATDCGIEGCPPGTYRSLFVVRADDPRGAVEDFDGASLAYNSDDSQSGWGAPVNAARERGIAFRAGPATGAHRRSAEAVAAGEAEIAAIDAASWRMIARQDAVALQLRVIGATGPTPGLPFITAHPALAPLLLETLRAALRALSEEERDCLNFADVVPMTPAAYLAVPNPPAP